MDVIRVHPCDAHHLLRKKMQIASLASSTYIYRRKRQQWVSHLLRSYLIAWSVSLRLGQPGAISYSCKAKARCFHFTPPDGTVDYGQIAPLGTAHDDVSNLYDTAI